LGTWTWGQKQSPPEQDEAEEAEEPQATVGDEKADSAEETGEKMTQERGGTSWERLQADHDAAPAEEERRAEALARLWRTLREAPVRTFSPAISLLECNESSPSSLCTNNSPQTADRSPPLRSDVQVRRAQRRALVCNSGVVAYLLRIISPSPLCSASASMWMSNRRPLGLMWCTFAAHPQYVDTLWS
jgi:hypothetical protein